MLSSPGCAWRVMVDDSWSEFEGYWFAFSLSRQEFANHLKSYEMVQKSRSRLGCVFVQALALATV